MSRIGLVLAGSPIRCACAAAMPRLQAPVYSPQMVAKMGLSSNSSSGSRGSQVKRCQTFGEQQFSCSEQHVWFTVLGALV